MAGAGTHRLRQFVDLDELRVLDALEHELGDAVAAAQNDRLGRIVGDDDHLDLAAIPGVDGARSVDETEPGTHGKARSRMHECRVTIWYGDRDAGGQERALTRS